MILAFFISFFFVSPSKFSFFFILLLFRVEVSMNMKPAKSQLHDCISHIIVAIPRGTYCKLASRTAKTGT